jgi:predicted RNA-binding Zn-ribbon protein involved in translation (DUF1610 family)
MKLKDVEKKEEKAVIEVCPLCGSKMEKGFIGVSREIFWSDKKRTIVWKLPFGNDVIVRADWTAAMREAYRCENCKLVIFRYGETSGAGGDSP